MKNLFKNSFKSFLKSRVTIILVSLIVFLTIGIFTLLTSSIISFRYSYDQVISENKLHDFTAKEKYDFSGNLGFDKGIYEQKNGKREFIKDKTIIQDFIKENPNSKTFSNDSQYIYFDHANGNSDSDNEIIKKGFLNVYDEIINKNVLNVEINRTQKKADNVIVRFKKNDLLLFYNKNNDVNNLVEKVFLQKNSTPFNILYKDSSLSSLELEKLSHNKNDYKSYGLKKYIEDKIKFQNYSWTSESSSKYKFEIKNSIEVGTRLYKSNNQDLFYDEKYTYIKNSVNNNDFINWMREKLNKNNYYIIEKNVEVYQIAPSFEKSSGVFKSLLKEIPEKNLKNITKEKIENWIISNGLDVKINPNDPILLKKINKKKSLLKTFIQSFITKAKRENYLSRINSLYGKYLDYRINRSVNISDKSKNFKIVEFNKNDKINKLKIFEGYLMPQKYTDIQMQHLMNKQLKLNKVSIDKETNISDKSGFGWSEKVKNSKAKIFKNKGFKWIAKWNENYVYNVLGVQATSSYIPKSLFVSDPSSYFAYVSPGYVKANKIKFVDPKKIMDDPFEVEKMILNPQYIYEKYPNSTIKIGEVNFLVIGSAIQPDYSFPIISSSHPIPNVEKEAIIFANTNGYLKTEDSYRGNEKENYISFRWKDDSNLSQEQKDYILYNSPKKYNNKNELTEISIEDISRESMNWPKNIRIISKNDDTSEQVILSPHRIVFLVKLKNMIEIVAFITIAMLLLATMLLIGIFIKKHINSNKKQFGILLANGYSKHQIALSNIIFSLIIMVVPSIFGYLLGFLLQYEFINIFKDYWTLPINAETYSWITIILYIIVPFIVVTLFSYFISRWELRNSIIEILSDATSKRGSFLSNFFINIFSWIGIKNKISISLFFTNFSKMLIILVVSITSIVTLSVGFTNIGKFSYAQNASEQMDNYNFSINLITPTNEGGLIKRASLKNNFGIDFKKSTDEIYKNLIFKASKFESNEPTWLIPNTSDEKNSKGIKYLDNKIQFQSLLNTIVGKGYSNSNPWKSSTESLIPEGQRLTSDKQRKKFNQYGITLKVNEKYENEKWFKNIKNTKIGIPLPENTGGLTSISKNYLKFIINTIRDISNNFDAKKKYLPTFITYKTILMNPNDETYTYIDATYNGEDISGKKNLDRIRIFGLKTNTKMINISKHHLNNLDNYKSTLKDETPILINAYFSDIYNVKKNDFIEFDINNKSNRNFVSKNKKGLFKVIGIVQSYNNSKIYTTQKEANKILGMDKLKFNGEKSEPFNGIFTNSKSPIVLNSIPLYSESGYYPGTDTLNENDDLIIKIISNIKKNGTNELKNKIKNELDYINLYSKSTYVASYANVDWSKMSQYAFDSTLNLSVKIIIIIETLAILFSIIFIVIITMMIISDNKKFISTLKVMGYKIKTINKIFFKSIIPSFIIAIFVAIPFVFAILIGMKLAIINFGHVLIPLDMVGWEIFSAIIVTFTLSTIIYYFSIKDLKNQSILEAFII